MSHIIVMSRPRKIGRSEKLFLVLKTVFSYLSSRGNILGKNSCEVNTLPLMEMELCVLIALVNFIVVNLRVLSHVLSCLTLGLVYEMSRDDPEIRSIMGLNEFTRVVRNCIFGFSFLHVQVQIQASSNKF